jgi:hypothetical protein
MVFLGIHLIPFTSQNFEFFLGAFWEMHVNFVKDSSDKLIIFPWETYYTPLFIVFFIVGLISMSCSGLVDFF